MWTPGVHMRFLIANEFYFAPRVGFEPTANRLTGDRSATELPRNVFFFFKEQ
jgi:hypothetical protein